MDELKKIVDETCFELRELGRTLEASTKWNYEQTARYDKLLEQLNNTGDTK